jgi:formylglycine-generating enzyme required for sulfatase activity
VQVGEVAGWPCRPLERRRIRDQLNEISRREYEDTAEDGYAAPCPVTAFPANGYGMYSAAGNVWEWVNDWFSPDYHVLATPVNPQGPPRGSGRVMRGGSFLCHDSYCNRYRVAARTSNTPDSSTTNLGFRCARDL